MEFTPALNYKNNSFSYAIQVTFDNGSLLRNTNYSDMFLVDHNFIYFNKLNNEKIKIKTQTKNCKKEDFYSLYNDFSIFKRQNISDFYCFDFFDNFTLQGIYTDDYMAYGEILIRINPNFLTNKNDSFYNFNNLQKIFNHNQFKFTLYYIDTFNDISSPNKKVFNKLDATYMYLDLNYYRRTNIFFQQFEFSEDKNLFYRNYNTSSFMKLYTLQVIDVAIDNRLDSPLEERSYLSKFFLRSINNLKIIKVSYIKIPEFLASLSGLIVNALFILKIIIFYYNSLEAKQSIINKIMKYKDIIKSNNRKTLDYISNNFKNENFRSRSITVSPSYLKELTKKSTNITDVKLKLQLIENYNSLNNVDSFNSSEDIIKEHEKNINNLTKKSMIPKKDKIENPFILLTEKLNPIADEKNNGLKEKMENENFSSLDSSIIIGKRSLKTIDYTKTSTKYKKNPYAIYTIDIICKLFCCKNSNKKQKIFDIAEKKFNHNLDMVTYMKKMQELDIIKYIILDKNTLELVNFISKPCISLSPKGIENPEYKLFFENIENKNSISYQNIDKIKKIYDTISNQSEKNYFEKRILDLFELQIEEIIK